MFYIFPFFHFFILDLILYILPFFHFSIFHFKSLPPMRGRHPTTQYYSYPHFQITFLHFKLYILYFKFPILTFYFFHITFPILHFQMSLPLLWSAHPTTHCYSYPHFHFTFLHTKFHFTFLHFNLIFYIFTFYISKACHSSGAHTQWHTATPAYIFVLHFPFSFFTFPTFKFYFSNFTFPILHFQLSPPLLWSAHPTTHCYSYPHFQIPKTKIHFTLNRNTFYLKLKYILPYSITAGFFRCFYKWWIGFWNLHC